MKRNWLSLVVIVAVALSVWGGLPAQRGRAAAFTPGNIVVYRVGDGSAALTANGTAVFLDEYNSAGTLQQSIPMRTTASGAQLALLANGTATSEGLLSLSEDRQYLIATGYNGTLGAAVSSATAAAVNRVIARVDTAGNADTSTALSNAFSASNIRGAVTDDGTRFWATGGNTGVVYLPFGAVTSSHTLIYSTTTNLRQIKIGNGQLYFTTASGTALRLAAVGTGKPTTAGQTAASLPGLPTTTISPYSFYFADLSAGVAGYDTLYLTDNGGGTITKYSQVGGTWTSNGAITLAGVSGLTGSHNGPVVALYATTTSNLYLVSDLAGYNQPPSSTSATPIAAAGTNRAFRGVAFAPGTGAAPNAVTLSDLSAASTTASPAPIILAGLGVAAAALLLRRKLTRVSTQN